MQYVYDCIHHSWESIEIKNLNLQYNSLANSCLPVEHSNTFSCIRTITLGGFNISRVYQPEMSIGVCDSTLVWAVVWFAYFYKWIRCNKWHKHGMQINNAISGCNFHLPTETNASFTVVNTVKWWKKKTVLIWIDHACSVHTVEYRSKKKRGLKTFIVV